MSFEEGDEEGDGRREEEIEFYDELARLAT
jgi:hypothetical protein